MAAGTSSSALAPLTSNSSSDSRLCKSRVNQESDGRWRGAASWVGPGFKAEATRQLKFPSEVGCLWFWAPLDYAFYCPAARPEDRFDVRIKGGRICAECLFSPANNRADNGRE